MRNILKHIKPGNPLLFQEVHRKGLRLPKQRRQHVTSVHLLLLRRLNMDRRTLQNPSQRQSLINIKLDPLRHRIPGSDVLFKPRLKRIQVCTTMHQDLLSPRIVKHGPKQVLQRDQIVPVTLGLPQRNIKHHFKFTAYHYSGSMLHLRGYSCSRARLMVFLTFVSATS